ncbi:nickel ABC transporter substrate-binding protein [Neobacillus niacini]|uniref:nickel ABC transporter substrate-binding protein n=1 Tax=Neobacillus niacini TaxID=86668 RepID=UPI0021CB45C9|nr:nickel ABC transporter substrate-binding protein [Neobacillus niacini]MCM3765623.1 ABC transporter substrate-binding protein [Neobacillus niacini]
MLKLNKFSLLFSLILMLLSACSSSEGANSPSGAENKNQETNQNKELTFLSNFPSETMDPHLNWTPLRAGIVETLVKINEDLQIEPWLATEWSSEDGQTWTFNIRENITFQNGNKLDAAAVKASFERLIVVSDSMKNALKIQSMNAEGQTLTIITEEPLPQFPSELVHPNAAIIDATEENFEQKPVGTGPFMVDAFEAGTKVTLKSYEQYWDGKPKLNSVILTFNDDANARTLALQSGDADISFRPAIESIEMLQGDSSIKSDVAPSSRTHLLMYNTNKEALSDVKLRKALDAMLDRDAIVASIMANQATAAYGPFLPQFPFAPDYEKKQFSMDLAKKYLEEAGYEIVNGEAKKDGKPLTLTVVTYSYRPELPLISQLLQSNAKQLGIKINIQVVENIDEYLMTTDWDLATYSLNTAPRGDASYFLNSVYMPGGAMNFSKLEHESLKPIINELNGTIEEDMRIQLAKEAVSIIDEEYLHSSIVYPNIFVAHKDSVEDWVTNKSEFYMITKDLGVK